MQGEVTSESREEALMHKVLAYKHHGQMLARLESNAGGAVVQALAQKVYINEVARYVKGGSYEVYAKASAETGRRANFVFRYGIIFVTFMQVGFLRLAKREVALFGVDVITGARGVDRRMEDVYAALKKLNKKPIEVFHTIISKKSFLNMVRRGRLALYHEAVNMLSDSRFPDIKVQDGLSDDERFVIHCANKLLYEISDFEKRIQWYRFFLKLARVRLVIAIDDARNYQAILEAARTLSIPSIAVQHGAGHFEKRFLGWALWDEFADMRIIKANTYVVWSEYWLMRALALPSVYLKEEILVGGMPERSKLVFAPKDTNKTILFVPYETSAPHEDVAEALDAMSGRTNTLIYMKLRNDQTQEKQLIPYMKLVQNKKLIPILSTGDCPLPDLALGVYSTLLTDAASSGVPFARINCSSTQGKLLEDGRSVLSVSARSSQEDLERILSDRTAILAMQQKRFGGTGALSETLTQKIADVLR